MWWVFDVFALRLIFYVVNYMNMYLFGNGLMKKDPKEKILAIVGAGHEDRIIELVKKIYEHKVEYVK